MERADGTAAAAREARSRLLAARGEHGHWEGELSSSALSTATAAIALEACARVLPGRASELRELARRGHAWLVRHVNEDGGYGDTVESPSNLSTTALAWTALGMTDEAEPRAVRARVEECLRARIGDPTPARLASALEEVYGADRTFAVPILTACAIGDAAGAGAAAWGPVRRLPFELAALPQSLFRWLGLPVVSYALPALIAIGQVIEHHKPSRNPLARVARLATRTKTLRVLERIQPAGGGFLEATPLTSFVLMSLASMGHAEGEVATRCLDFLVSSVRADGSWPIDTNLATWVTTLSVNALGGELPAEDKERLVEWLLGQQYTARHPYTGAAPGGWAWTDLSGGVPDADDTPGAILALRALAPDDPRVRAATHAGARWLTGLQNRDGGVPTFCRGWGKLPFDESCADLTAHAIRAWSACLPDAPPALARDLRRALERAAAFLVESRRPDGAWVPLWFGNQHAPNQENPVYGTSRVLRAAGATGLEGPSRDTFDRALERALAWLLSVQHEDGGFGGDRDVPPTIEETAVALEALNAARRAGLTHDTLEEATRRAAAWLAQATHGGTRFDPAPIGLYFAKLWYTERLYPLVFTVAALEGIADDVP